MTREGGDDVDARGRAVYQQLARSRRLDRRARRSKRGTWGQVARAGALGWVVILPALAGAYGGLWLDRRLGGGVTWTLGLMFSGLAAGVYSLVRLLGEEQAAVDDEARAADEEGAPRS
ncbi:MAG: AtpZ/AtpI family protein [Myxococcales bacterium]|nr:AtpZ/AtpI family protein [Myxococcales bacterium]